MKRIANLDKIYSYFTKSEFDRKFPLFSKYSFDENFKNNACDNADLYRKYNQYNESITIYLYELDKRFDNDTIKKIIIETIFKNPDEIMMSIITSYLNSEESVKSNANFVSFYNKTSNFGTESIEYMQENGIILDRTYKDIPNLAIDAKYDHIKTGNESFKGESLESVYESLTYPERRFVLSLIENHSYELLDLLFSRFNFNTKLLIKVLMNKGIKPSLFNNDLVKELDSIIIIVLFCYMIENDNTFILANNISKLVNNKKYDLIKNIVINNLIDNLNTIPLDDSIENYLDDEVINILTNKGKSLQIYEEAA